MIVEERPTGDRSHKDTQHNENLHAVEIYGHKKYQCLT